MKKTLRKILPVLALVLVVAVASVGGTIAWLTAKTETVTNTFTTADINIELTETFNAKKSESSTQNDTWTAKLVPGKEYEKDPKVTVKSGSEACWLFVHVADVNNTIDGLNDSVVAYSVRTTGDDAWTAVPDHSGFYYRRVDAATEDKSFYVLTDNKVTINANLTKTQEEAIRTANTTPMITVTAAAVQQDGINDVITAWSKLPAEFTGTSGT